MADSKRLKGYGKAFEEKLDKKPPAKSYDKLFECDVLVIGAGGAGLRAAIEAHDDGSKVVVVGKTLKGKAHTVMAEGGVNAALGNLDPEDNWKVHAEDTLREGAFLGDARLVETLCREAIDRVRELEDYGVVFDRTPDGKIMQRPFGAHSHRRTCHVGDRTGLELLQTLLSQIRKRKSITILDEVLVTKIFVDASKYVSGAAGFELQTGEFIHFKAKSVVLATGGCCRVYKVTSNSGETWGNGVALAYNAGAELMDMEMIQFHPTGMIAPESARGILVTESVRGEGGTLTNNLGERFMEKYDAQRMELSARDVVARAIYWEIKEGRGTPNGGVYLDISHKPPAHVLKKLPKMHKQFIDFAGVDITKEKMEVSPTAHYMMGGVRTNHETTESTTINGLFVAGESAAGVHGANRLGGNSLSDILVFGRRAGFNAAQFAKRQKQFRHVKNEELEKEFDRVTLPMGERDGPRPKELKAALQEVMWQHASIARNREGLETALKVIEGLKKDSETCKVQGTLKYNPEWIDYVELIDGLVCAEAIVRSALTRTESRGAHYREDFTKTDNKDWLVNISCSKGAAGKMKLQKHAVQPIKGDLSETIQLPTE